MWALLASLPEHEPASGEEDAQHGVESIISSDFMPRCAAPATTRSIAASSAGSRRPAALGSRRDHSTSTRTTLAWAFWAAFSAASTVAWLAQAPVGTPCTPYSGLAAAPDGTAIRAAAMDARTR